MTAVTETGGLRGPLALRRRVRAAPPTGLSSTTTRHEAFPHFIREMKQIGYSGYMGYELCHPLPVVDGQTVGVEFAEKNAKLAAEFMRGLIKG